VSEREREKERERRRRIKYVKQKGSEMVLQKTKGVFTLL
jgi:hypothetical protein